MTADDRSNVIYVSFRPGGGVRVRPEEDEPAPRPPPAEPAAPAPPSGPGSEPYGELFTRREVARLFELPDSRLRYWDRSGFLSPSARVGRRRFYTFQDLIGVRAARELLEAGLPLARVRRSVEAIRERLPHITRPLSEMRVVADGPTVIVKAEAQTFEAETGQLRLDFDVRSLRDEVVRVLRPEVRDGARRKKAYAKYLEGCRFDEDEATFAKAEACYREALELDPQLANALTNWGNLRFRRGESEEAAELYQRALALDPEQPEAHYNLGFLAYEGGDLEGARKAFEAAVHYDPGFADAHFNLAMACEEQGDADAARGHWATYLELDPVGTWAEVARRHLKAT
jgi:tetratricopeptide (TPR) repeat protein